MRGRRKARESSVQVLYSLNFVNIDVQKALDVFWCNFVAPQTAKEFAVTVVQGTWEHKEELDRLIADCSDNWSLKRMSKVDISVFRLAVFELLYCDALPPQVTLNS